jgi:mono/diheme cytochrome c family protein
MKTLKKVLVRGLIVVVLAVVGLVAFLRLAPFPPRVDRPPRLDIKVEVTPERVAVGRKYAAMLCAGCHLDPTTDQLTGKLMSDAPSEFGEIHSKNITADPTHGIGAWSDGELVYFLRTGINRSGEFIPPYMIKLAYLSDEELLSIIAFLRSDDPMVKASAVENVETKASLLTRFLSRTAFRPLPYPTAKIEAPPLTDKVAYGRYLATALDCYPCHSADFKKIDVAHPEQTAGFYGGGNSLYDLGKKIVYTPNITAEPETGIGKWTESEFVRALRGGFRPDSSPIRYPMLTYPELTDEQAGAIYAYLRTVPQIKNARRSGDAYLVAAGASDGQKIYYKYQCYSCHGEAGLGMCDLRQANKKYPADDALIAWIRDPSRLKPETKMPTWQGVIAEAEYPPLARYVRELGEKAGFAAR